MAKQDFSVFIAEDNDLNRWLLCEQLQHWTQAITVAKEGREALQLLQRKRFSLVFLDLNLPYLSGLDLVQTIRVPGSVNESTPAIAITAQTPNERNSKLLSRWFNACLFKPVLLKDLGPIIEKWSGFSQDNVSTYYAGQLVKKTEHNRELCLKLLDKFFIEVPEFLRDIEQAQKADDYGQAWQIAHQLHGTFCFFAFADFMAMAERLEDCLGHRDGPATQVQLLAIKHRFSEILKNKVEIVSYIGQAEL